MTSGVLPLMCQLSRRLGHSWLFSEALENWSFVSRMRPCSLGMFIILETWGEGCALSFLALLCFSIIGSLRQDPGRLEIPAQLAALLEAAAGESTLCGELSALLRWRDLPLSLSQGMLSMVGSA